MKLWHPLFARPCTMCEQYAYTASGELQRDDMGNPRERPKGVPTPCLSCPKVPIEARERGLPVIELRKVADELTEWNKRAYDTYKGYKGINRFPDDPIVKWYAGVIREVEDAHARYLAEKQSNSVAALITLVGLKLRG